MRKSILVIVALAVISVWPGIARAQFSELTGVWHTSTGATFYVRQIASEIWWYGTPSASQPAWTNVASGFVVGNIVRVRWVDVPQGPTRGSGTVALKIVDANHLVVTENPDNFLTAPWSR